MKRFKIFSAMAGVLLTLLATGCESEKDLIIIEGNLPIKTTTLYMVGDATPAGWNIGDPVPFTPSEEDGLLFTWEGTLNPGEFKLCLIPGSWDNAFIRPVENGTAVTKEPITDAPFAMHAGDPDDKWVVLDAGKYLLSFNLREWTMSTTYLGEAEAKPVEPIETEAMYLVGDATSAGWNIDDPMPIDKTGQYTFEYEGRLKVGEFKGYLETGNWNADAIRPKTANVEINKEGVESDELTFAASPDNKWKVTEEGLYHLTFDLENWKIDVKYLGEAPYEDPLLTATKVYLIGDATSGGWGWENCITMEPTGNAHEFTWTGELAVGSIKGSVDKDYNTEFIRPETDGVEINASGVAAPNFVFTVDPDDKWYVSQTGIYTLTLNLEKSTITATFDGENPNPNPDPDPDPNPNPTTDPIVAETVYIIGSATPAGWNIDVPVVLAKTGAYTYVYEGPLYEGEIKACTMAGTWDQPFIRPESDGQTISKSGVSAPNFVYRHESDFPDYKWNVTAVGNYTLTFDLEHYTITAKYNGEIVPDKTPIEASFLYMIGDATPNGWDMGRATELEQDVKNEYIFTWTGALKTGELKACLVKDNTFSCPFIRPSKPGVEISESGVAADDFVFTTNPDDKWVVTKAGNYTLTFDLEHYTIKAVFNN